MAKSWDDFAAHWKPMLDDVWAFLHQTDLRTDGHNVMLYRGKVPSLEFEVGVEVADAFESAGPVVLSCLPEGRATHTVHTGDCAGLSGAHEAVARWCQANGHVPSGTRWELYGDWDPDPARMQTALYWMVEG